MKNWNPKEEKYILSSLQKISYNWMTWRDIRTQFSSLEDAQKEFDKPFDYNEIKKTLYNAENHPDWVTLATKKRGKK